MKVFLIFFISMITYIIYFMMALFQTPIRAMERSSQFMTKFEKRKGISDL